MYTYVHTCAYIILTCTHTTKIKAKSIQTRHRANTMQIANSNQRQFVIIHIDTQTNIFTYSLSHNELDIRDNILETRDLLNVPSTRYKRPPYAHKEWQWN